jgi:hypothetical protein
LARSQRVCFGFEFCGENAPENLAIHVPIGGGTMIRKIAAIIVGALVAVALIAAVQFLGHEVYPPPTDIDVNDRAAMEVYAASVPTGALLFVGFSWMVGAFGGGMLAIFIARESVATNCLIVGGLVMAGTIMTLISIPHPLWFSITSVIALIATLLLTTKIGTILSTDKSTEQKTT